MEAIGTDAKLRETYPLNITGAVSRYLSKFKQLKPPLNWVKQKNNG